MILYNELKSLNIEEKSFDLIVNQINFSINSAKRLGSISEKDVKIRIIGFLDCMEALELIKFETLCNISNILAKYNLLS